MAHRTPNRRPASGPTARPIADRRRERAHLPFWRKPNWVVPMFGITVNGAAVVLVAVFASGTTIVSNGLATAPATSPAGPTTSAPAVLANQVQPGGPWDLAGFGLDGYQLAIECRPGSMPVQATLTRRGVTLGTRSLCDASSSGP